MSDTIIMLRHRRRRKCSSIRGRGNWLCYTEMRPDWFCGPSETLTQWVTGSFHWIQAAGFEVQHILQSTVAGKINGTITVLPTFLYGLSMDKVAFIRVNSITNKSHNKFHLSTNTGDYIRFRLFLYPSSGNTDTPS